MSGQWTSTPPTVQEVEKDAWWWVRRKNSQLAAHPEQLNAESLKAHWVTSGIYEFGGPCRHEPRKVLASATGVVDWFSVLVPKVQVSGTMPAWPGATSASACGSK